MDCQLICKQCGMPRERGRKLCRLCNLKRLRTIAKNKPRYMYNNTCVLCQSLFKAWHKNQKLCKSCYILKKTLAAKSRVSGKYVMLKKPGKTEHRSLCESILGRYLACNEVVHHISGNPTDNQVNNLIVITRDTHRKLHAFLEMQRVILEKSSIDNPENCWKTLITPTTNAWLETAEVKVIRMWEIGQSAAEPL